MTYPLSMPSGFPAAHLEALASAVEVEIETSPVGGEATHRTIIWVVVDGQDAFIRSYRGHRARWYREALARPEVAVLAGECRIPARALPAPDERSVERASAGFERKYAGDPATPAMLRSEILPTTLRLEPA